MPAPTVAEFVERLNAYLAQGWALHSIGGGAGEDWRELRIVLRRPRTADATHREVLGGAP